jgi:hypothetical protein
MIEVLEQDNNIICIQAKDKLTHEDYEQVLIPRLEQLIKEHGKVRVLFAMGDDCHGWEPAAMWDDAKFGMKHRTDFEKCAVVGGPKWVEWATKLGAVIISGEVRTFSADQLVEAQIWIKSPIEAPVN